MDLTGSLPEAHERASLSAFDLANKIETNWNTPNPANSNPPKSSNSALPKNFPFELEFIGMYELVLASESPRRRQLLQEAGFSFHILPVKVSEIPQKNLNVDEQIVDIARQKADACISTHKLLNSQRYLVLSSDTEVVVNDSTLGKPVDKSQSLQFLDLLSGRIHEVKTALYLVLLPEGKVISHIETTKVEFFSLTPEQKSEYASSSEPYDKAGGYAIQGEAKKFIKNIDGDLQNVIGLPVKAFKTILEREKISLKKI